MVASHMRPAFVSQTWSLLQTGGRANCHAFFIGTGEARLTLLDGSTVLLAANSLIWVPAALGQQLRLEAGGSGIAMSAPPEFVWGTIGDSAMAVDLKFLMNEIALAEAEAVPLDDVRISFEAIAREAGNPEPGSASIVRFNLGLILLHLWRAVGVRAPGAGMRPELVSRFRQLVEVHFRDGMTIDDYAARLGVTRSRLRDSCMRAEQMAPLAIVHARILDEAQRKLVQTDMSVEQVAFSLGFRDPPYFNRFFTRLAGTTPGAYRKAAASPAAPERPSFAAWP
jgi:AraC family transcriptional activator of pobA